MNLNLIIKFLSINIGLYYFYIKIINFKQNSKFQAIPILIILTGLSVLEGILPINLSSMTKIVISYIFFGFYFSKSFKINISNSLLITFISICSSYTIYAISTVLVSLVLAIFAKINYQLPIISFIMLLLQIAIIHLFFTIKKFKNGFPFLINTIDNNTNLDLIFLILNMIVLFIYFWMQNYKQQNIKYLAISFIIFSLTLIPILYETFIIYQKQKLQTQALKDYETQLSETQQKLQTALAEKQTLIKSNHEFHHRQKALNKKLDDLAKQYSENYNTEFAEELGNISKRLDKLSDEYVEKTHFSPALVKSNIEEIDDMLSYMKSECEKNNIDFSLKIDCDINYIINNFITKSQLETLLGDLISNSIIAISHSSNNYKNIMVIFGIKDSTYELCILDSGIPFEIDTLLNLGLSPASTHLDEGGTGIGFITTFETINHCNASITISENTNNNYTKSIEIQFDNKNEYRIITNRKDDLIKRNINNRKIIIID